MEIKYTAVGVLSMPLKWKGTENVESKRRKGWKGIQHILYPQPRIQPQQHPIRPKQARPYSRTPLSARSTARTLEIARCYRTCARVMVESSILGRKFSGVLEVSISMYVFGSREHEEEAKGRKKRRQQGHTSDNRRPQRLLGAVQRRVSPRIPVIHPGIPSPRPSASRSH